jgi:hypothetical protein
LQQSSRKKSILEEDRYIPTVSDANQHNVKRYAGFVRSFEGLAKSQDKYSLVVIQPAPLYKKLTEYEKNVVGDLGYGGHYKKVISAVKQGSKNFLDLSQIFYDSTEEIFSDHIHFTNLGSHKSLGNYYIAIEILKRMEKDRQIDPKDNLNNCLKSLAPH